MRHAISILAYNCLDLTKRAIASALVQDIGPCDIYVTDNGSRDNTWEYLRTIAGKHGEHEIHPRHYEDNHSPVIASNRMLEELFGKYDKVLGMPNDVILPANLYRLFDEFPRGVVTGSMTSDIGFPEVSKATAVSECTPMAVVLLRKFVYDALVQRYGHFYDEGFFHYASDCDFALRFSALGMRGVQLDLQYYHEGSATLHRSAPELASSMHQQADRDRAYFLRKWGFAVADPYYGQNAVDPNFKGIPVMKDENASLPCLP